MPIPCTAERVFGVENPLLSIEQGARQACFLQLYPYIPPLLVVAARSVDERESGARERVAGENYCMIRQSSPNDELHIRAHQPDTSTANRRNVLASGVAIVALERLAVQNSSKQDVLLRYYATKHIGTRAPPRQEKSTATSH